MEGMARSGGGNFYYLERPEQIPDFLMSELGEALEVVARDASIVVEVDPGVMIHSLDGRRTTRNGRTVEVALDDLVSRQQMELVLRVTFPRGAMGATSGITIALTDRDGVMQVSPERIEWEYSRPPRQRRPGARPVGGPLRGPALRRPGPRGSRRAEPHRRTGEGAQCSPGHRPADPGVRRPTIREMRRLVHELEQLAHRHRERFDAHSLKRERFEAYSIREAKDLLGRKMRMP